MLLSTPRSLMVVRPRSVSQILSLLLYGLILAMGLSLPFQLFKPILSLPGIEFNNLELLADVVILGAVGQVLHLGWTGRLRPEAVSWWRSHKLLLLSGLLLVLLTMTSALLAPEYQLQAFKFGSHYATGFCIFLVTIYVLKSYHRITRLVWAVLLGAGLSSVAGFAEIAGWPALGPLLRLFQEEPAHVGGALRLSSTFVFTTYASMFFEMTIPPALAIAARARSRTGRYLALAIAAGCTMAVVLTMTRAGLITLAAIFGSILGLALLRRRWRPLSAPTLLVLACLATFLALLTISSPMFRTRLTTENDLGWYGAAYVAPPTLSVRQGQEVTISVQVTNQGQATWEIEGDKPFALAFRWLSADGQAMLGPSHVEVPLPHNVEPQQTIRLPVRLTATLPPGRYLLSWGMLQRDILWFRQRNVPEAVTAVEILGGTAATLPSPPPTSVAPGDDGPDLSLVMSRTQLWLAASRMIAERPSLGFGPDNFHHFYGRYLGLPKWGLGHAHNLYLELSADIGLLGLSAFGGLLAVVVSRLIQVCRRSSGRSISLLAVGLGGSLLAILAHGFVDYFLDSTSLYLFFWILLGMIVALHRAHLAFVESGNASPVTPDTLG